MYQYAHIIDGLVADVFADNLPLDRLGREKFAIGKGPGRVNIVEVTGHDPLPAPGWSYDEDAGVFSPPPGTSLADLKAAKLAEMYSAYQKAKTAIVWCNGRGYDADPGSRDDFFEVKELVRDDREEWLALPQAERDITPEPTRPYRVYIEGDGKQVLPHTYADFVAAQRAGADVQMAAFLRFDSRRAEIAAAETAEEVEAITW